jgi:putative spermidine/putrescine transport system ATP-binding protein
MSVLQNVEYGLRVKKVAKGERRKRATEALETVRLVGYGDRRPFQLSGGQRQRVALARALVNRPKVLLLDEPLGALDLKLRRQMQIELKQIQRDVGITFVFVTHDQEEALTMSDRIAVFNEGHVEQLDSPVDLYERPVSAFVAGFVGTSNLLQGDAARKVVGDDGTFVIRPEKIGMSSEPQPPDPGVCSAPGLVREVVYLGSTTMSVVELDAGPALTVSHQNTDTSIDAALERRSQRVVLTFRRDHLVSLAGSESGPGVPIDKERS